MYYSCKYLSFLCTCQLYPQCPFVDINNLRLMNKISFSCLCIGDLISEFFKISRSKRYASPLVFYYLYNFSRKYKYLIQKECTIDLFSLIYSQSVLQTSWKTYNLPSIWCLHMDIELPLIFPFCLSCSKYLHYFTA